LAKTDILTFLGWVGVGGWTYRYINYVSVTEAGLFTLYGLGLLDLIPLEATFKLPGNFYGLEVLGQYSEDPVILTTQKVFGFTVVNMIGEN
jgi:hypothetical protein